MLITKFIPPLRLLKSARQFSSTAVRSESKPTPTGEQQSTPCNKNEFKRTVMGGAGYNVTPFDKRLLVWVKRYPNMDAVPNLVSQECILQARSKARVKACNYMIGIFVLGFIYGIVSGKRDRAAGDTVMRRGEQWHRRLAEEGQAEAAAKNAAES